MSATISQVRQLVRASTYIAAWQTFNVYRSLANIYAQVIDDEKGVTLVSASTQDKGFENYGGNIEAAKAIGAEVAKRALEKGISEVVFDRGGYVYHGRVAALAEAAREAGLKF